MHLVGIHPARGSQSISLRQESDTTTEWDKDLISKFMTVSGAAKRAEAAAPAQAAAEKGAIEPPAPDEKAARHDRAKVHTIVEEVIASLDTDDLAALDKYWASGAGGIPSDIDRPLLGKCRDAIGRDLLAEERRQARHFFASRSKALIGKAR